MKNRFNIIALGLIVGIVAYYFINSWMMTNSGTFPELNENLMDGREFKLQDLEGTIVLLDFWGSWCAPCRRENPKLAALYAKFHDRKYEEANNFEIVSVAMERNGKTIKDAIKKDGLVWPYHILKQSKILLASRLARNFGVTDLPTKFLYNQNGRLIGKNMSISEIEAYLERQLVD